MTDVWNIISQYFKSTENWGNADKMSGTLLLLLFALRKVIGRTFVIHEGFATSGHTTGSQHGLGNAVDFHIQGLPFVEAVAQMETALHALQVADRCGLGIYPDWNNPGFHLDVRGTKARWGRIGRDYVSFDEALKAAARRNLV